MGWERASRPHPTASRMFVIALMTTISNQSQHTLWPKCILKSCLRSSLPKFLLRPEDGMVGGDHKHNLVDYCLFCENLEYVMISTPLNNSGACQIIMFFVRGLYDEF